jgi:uncharacterized surface protein with fasciclin (FAS1) repeats
MKITHSLATLILATGISFTAFSQTVLVGGSPMYKTENIISNALKSKDHTSLVTAVKAAELVTTLLGAGPFTEFAPVNDAFENLPAGTVETLL